MKMLQKSFPLAAGASSEIGRLLGSFGPVSSSSSPSTRVSSDLDFACLVKASQMDAVDAVALRTLFTRLKLYCIHMIMFHLMSVSFDYSETSI